MPGKVQGLEVPAASKERNCRKGRPVEAVPTGPRSTASPSSTRTARRSDERRRSKRSETLNRGRPESRPHDRSSFIRDPDAIFFPQFLNEGSKKEKEAKRKNGEARGICRKYENRSRSPSAIFFLMIFTLAVENPAGFSTATTGPAAMTSTRELKTNG